MLSNEDVNEIHQLLAEYGHVIDDHDWERAHLVFADDFVFERSASGLRDLHGIADIVANFKGRNLYAHVTTNIAVYEATHDTATAHSKFIGFPNEGPPVTGDYYDQLVRTSAGWRLARRRAELRQRKFFD